MITWVVYRLMRWSLPLSHPWKLPIPYKLWMPHRTQLCRDFDFLIGLSGFGAIFALLFIYFT